MSWIRSRGPRMPTDYKETDYDWIRELLDYPRVLEERLAFFDDTSQIHMPADPIERVIFQERAKMAIRKVAQNRGHMLMVGRPGTGKSMLADMFREVLDRSVGDYLQPRTPSWPSRARTRTIFGRLRSPGKDRRRVAGYPPSARHRPEQRRGIQPGGTNRLYPQDQALAAGRRRRQCGGRHLVCAGIHRHWPHRDGHHFSVSPRKQPPGPGESPSARPPAACVRTSSISMTWCRRCSTTRARKRISWRASPSRARAT